jgi:antitoxin MazE
MKTKLVKIGNSRGIRLPKAIIEQVGLTDSVELQVEGDRIVIRGAADPRAGWEEAAQRMHACGDDVLLDDWVPTKFDQEEWEW